MIAARCIVEGIQIFCKYLKPEDQYFGTYETRFLMPSNPRAIEAQPYIIYDKSKEDLRTLEGLGWRYSYSGWRLEID